MNPTVVVIFVIVITIVSFVKADECYNDYQKFKQITIDNQQQYEIDSLNFDYKAICEK